MDDLHLQQNPFENLDKYKFSVMFRDFEEAAKQIETDNGVDELYVDSFLIAFAMERIMSRCTDRFTRLIAKMNMASHICNFPTENNNDRSNL